MDLRLRREPGLRGRRFPVRQQPDRPPPLQIADQGAVAMVTSPCPVVDPNYPRCLDWQGCASPYQPQQRIVADRQLQAPGQVRRRTTTQGQTELVDQKLHADGSACPGLQDFRAEALGKDLLRAARRIAAEAAGQEREPHPATGER